MAMNWEEFGWSAPEAYAAQHGAPVDAARVATVRAKFEFLKQAIVLACQDDWGKTYPVREALETVEKALCHLSNQVAAASVAVDLPNVEF